MKLSRDIWTPLVVTIETHEEAEILHKILGLVTDGTDGRNGNFLSDLFFALGRGLDLGEEYGVSGGIKLSVRS